MPEFMIRLMCRKLWWRHLDTSPGWTHETHLCQWRQLVTWLSLPHHAGAHSKVGEPKAFSHGFGLARSLEKLVFT